MGEPVHVVFTRRKLTPDAARADCVVDVGNVHDPARLRFDHKPPAFVDRNETCAARLVWEHLIARSEPIGHLSDLVQAIHEGDRNPPERAGPCLARSRKEGFHAHLATLRPTCGGDDSALYAVASTWLDDYDQGARQQW